MKAPTVHFKTVAEYLDSLPKEVRETVETLRKTIHKVIPEAKEVISYNIPTYTLDDSYVIYYAAWKKHISLYPFSSRMTTAFPETTNYNTSGKGTIQFPLDKPLPLPLIRKIVTFRLKEVLGKQQQ